MAPMFKYLQTTFFILSWCGLLSLVWAVVCFYGRERLAKLPSIILPALVWGPVLLTSCYLLMRVNLLFPVHFFADLKTIWFAALVPALVLVLASGLATNIRFGVITEFRFWMAKPFALFSRAYGADPLLAVRKLVLVQALAQAWSRCLPWLFGELVVVEAVGFWVVDGTDVKYDIGGGNFFRISGTSNSVRLVD